MIVSQACSHGVVGLPQPGERLSVDLRRVGDAQAVRDHAVPAFRRLQAALRRHALELDANIQACGCHLDDAKLLALAEQADIRIGGRGGHWAKRFELRHEAVERLALLCFVACEALGQPIRCTGFGLRGVSQRLHNRHRMP